MNALAEWLAPAATMIAALMTAANLGARVTGWGFVAFTIGSVLWVIVGLKSGQQGLVIANGFLAAVNAIGVWRWLGRQARYDAVGDSAEAIGTSPAMASVCAATALAGRAIVDGAGATVGEAVEAIIDCQTGTICQIVMRFGGVGGIGEQIVAVPFSEVRLAPKSITTRLRAENLERFPRLEASQWPRILEESSPSRRDGE